jgi:hypothetical protein
MLTVEKVKSIDENDNFGFIIFESSNGKYYGLILAMTMSVMQHLKLLRIKVISLWLDGRFLESVQYGWTQHKNGTWGMN